MTENQIALLGTTLFGALMAIIGFLRRESDGTKFIPAGIAITLAFGFMFARSF